MTRSFLETSPPYAETGWAVLTLQPPAAAGRDLHGRTVGVFAPPSGLDRIALATALRAQDAQVIVLPNAEAVTAGLRAGRFEAAVTEKLNADRIATSEHLGVEWLPGDLPRYGVAFGLWKGDLTLKRAFAGALQQHIKDGSVATILARYLSKSS